jgi:alkylation response protein AidB-like acyl-CoA dehydrogenase
MGSWRGVSLHADPSPLSDPGPAVAAALAAVAEEAADRDQAGPGRFPTSAFDHLREAGLTAWNAIPGPDRPPAAAELDLVRRVAAADGSVGRIFDGHVNAVERVAVQAPADLHERELAAVRAGRLLAGVWGGDPLPGEGPPAVLLTGGAQPVLRGVKTFCSGAGGLDRALVLARNETGGPPVSVWVDLTDAERVEVDRSWYRGAGLRASESHRVVFHDALVLGQLGGPGAIAAAPWFGRDALRTAASWVGMADTALAGALDALAARPESSDLEARAAARIRAHHHTMERWLEASARAMDDALDGDPAAEARLADVALDARVTIADGARALLEEAGRACGSHPFAASGPLDRARRDLELFLLQHRLDPLLARAGRKLLEDRR